MQKKEILLSGYLLIVLTMTSTLFLISKIIDSSMNYDSEQAHILSYFTIQSNIIVAIWMLALSLYILTNKKIYKFAKNINVAASITTYILVTGFIYWLVLVPILYAPGVTWLFSTSNIWFHALTPIAAFILFLYIKILQKNKIKPRLLLFSVYPIIYVIFASFYAVKGIYLYPMFNPEFLGGWIGVLLCIAVICLIFTGLYLILLYGLKRAKKTSQN